MFQKKAIVIFLEKHVCGDQSHRGVQLEAWNDTKEKPYQIYFLATYLKLLTSFFLPLGQLR